MSLPFLIGSYELPQQQLAVCPSQKGTAYRISISALSPLVRQHALRGVKCRQPYDCIEKLHSGKKIRLCSAWRNSYNF